MIIRPYQQSDDAACIRIINKVWDFDSRYCPEELSEFFKRVYLLTSLSKSNFACVVEEDNNVQGFLFGNSGRKNLYRMEYSGITGSLRIVIEMLSIPGVPLKRKLQYAGMQRTHEKNRKKIAPDSENEVNLFAVDPEAQGRGHGKRLMGEFIKYCRRNNARKISLETDEESNYTFYSRQGFRKTGEFFSPSLQDFTGSSGNTYVYELELDSG